MAKFYWLSIKEIHRETDQSVVISFNVPEALVEVFAFIPGQYITLQKELNGALIRRDYSICASKNSNQLKVGIKAVENGLFSQYANTQLKAGDEIEVSAPKGRFNLKTNALNKNSYLAFAAGSGITPVLSMISSSLEDEPESTFVLIFGNKSVKDIMFRQELQQLKATYADRFYLHYVLSQENHKEYGSGRINAAMVHNVVEVAHKDLSFDAFYLCGPEPMINEVKKTLETRGIPENNIHFELFTSSSASENLIEDYKGETEVVMYLDDDEESFTMRSDQSILEAALLEGLDAPYSCQGGICSTCIAQVKEGKALMKKNSILTDAEIEDGLILTCQAHPATPKLTIDYDAV